MSLASAFILAQDLAPEVSWGRGRRVGQVEGAGREEGSEEKAIRNQKPVQRRKGPWTISTLPASGSGICPLGGSRGSSYM